MKTKTYDVMIRDTTKKTIIVAIPTLMGGRNHVLPRSQVKRLGMIDSDFEFKLDRIEIPAWLAADRGIDIDVEQSRVTVEFHRQLREEDDDIMDRAEEANMRSIAEYGRYLARGGKPHPNAPDLDKIDFDEAERFLKELEAKSAAN